MKQAVLYGVYTAKFPFLESNDSKVRPVIVMSEAVGSYGAMAVIPVSTKVDKQSVDFSLVDWRQAGLLRPSVARVHRISTIISASLGSHLGVLTTQDSKELRLAIKSFLKLED